MNILFWNCRGIARPSFTTHLSYLINAHKPHIVILSETRTNSPNSVTIVRKLPFDSWEILDPVGFTGGIIILWNARDVAISLVDKGSQMINVVAQVSHDNFIFLLTAVYASPKFKHRVNLWTALNTLSQNLSHPWVCIGDFNEITDPCEKFGGNGIKWNRVNLYKTSMDSCNLFDLGFSGPKFTWTNKRRQNPILERLDRVWVNQTWLDHFPNSHNVHLTRLSSDHCPILLCPTLPNRAPIRAFKFESFWVSDHSFLPIVASSWSSSSGDVPNKLHSLSLTLSTWARNTFGSIQRNKNILNARIRGVQRDLCHAPNSDYLNQLHDSLTHDLNRVLDSENSYWQDRARINWLIDGDRNTAFFQKSVTLRRSFNRIISLVDEVGHTISGHDGLAAHITDFFNTLYTTDKTFTNWVIPITPPSITVHTVPSEDEIRLALFSLGSKKAPGPDGFHAGFYKNCWHIVKVDLIPFIQRVFLTKYVPECINKTAISLIPKTLTPQTIKNFRPISLCNTSYKIITKIIVNRLKPFMHKIISPNQGSSIPGRGTDTNFIIASEILHSMHTSKCKLGWFALKLDLEKAFDRLEWDFVRLCLSNARIDNDTISLIMRCISSSSTQVALNGTLLSSFSPSRGIRQGDPLSPYLFILCMEALSTLIHQSCDDSDWSPFPLGKGGASFSHLLFADDILLFGRASEKNLCAVQDTLHTFCSSSGQKINFSKSKLLFSKHTSTVHTNMFETALGIKATSNLGTYLGFPLKGTKPKKADLRGIVEAIQSKLSNWKTNFLSKAGRLCLINSTISTIPSHSMQCIRLPSSILSDIDKITRSFLWSGASSKKLHLSNWDLVTLPLAHGGLGVKAARSLNDAYSMKLSWNILLNKNSLISVAIRSKYPTPSPYSFRLGSHIWKNVGVGLPLLQDHTIWSIGDGASVCLWSDCWSSLGPLRAVIQGPLTSSSSNAKLQSLIINGAWIFDSLDFVLPDDMLNTILAIPLPSASKPDLLTTNLAPKGKFSISSAYSSLLNLSNHPPTFTPTLEWLWDLPTLPKIKFFLWLVWWDKLPHKLTLFKRNIIPSPSCLLCPNPSLKESSLHLLRDCSIASSVWSLLNVDHSFFSLDLQPWIHENCTSRNSSWATLFSVILWRLWVQRCDSTFNDTPPRPSLLFRDATINLALSWAAASSPSLPPSPSVVTSASCYPCSWALPPLGWFKINVDAAFSLPSSLACIGCVVRNDLGSWVRGWSRRFPAPTPFVSEVLAIREGLRAGLASMDSFIIASDCLIAVTSILSEAQPCGQFANVILECRDLLESSTRLKIAFEKRSANGVADALAKVGLVDSSPSNGCINWDFAPPFVLRLCTIYFVAAIEPLPPDPPP
ncbi:uncharacterized protein LOC141588743 [Silene latifolia]|uniref:uncharacterized protein LOC141588743 n=1 Tax=Silene latifolia TaxID=37657 RepID=UPI003D77573D